MVMCGEKSPQIPGQDVWNIETDCGLNYMCNRKILFEDKKMAISGLTTDLHVNGWDSNHNAIMLF